MRNYPENWMAFFPWNQPILLTKNKVRDTPIVVKEDLLKKKFLLVEYLGEEGVCVFAVKKNNQLSKFTAYQ